jgi:predicted nucleotidyltransferase
MLEKTDGPTAKALAEFKQAIAAIYGPRLRRVVLYGSWARGVAGPDSDIDVAVVLEGDVRPGEEIDRMLDATTDINLKHGVLLAVYPVSERNWQSLCSPLLLNLRREGVPA